MAIVPGSPSHSTGLQGEPLPSWRAMPRQGELQSPAIPTAPVLFGHSEGGGLQEAACPGPPTSPGPQCPCTALACQARSTIFGISSAPLIGTRRVTGLGKHLSAPIKFLLEAQEAQQRCRVP